ncbi:M20/M25/M40 family metallo-hydrolase [Micromonospora sp. WMMA1923]|uniref:M20/M25/M40 family metallo-hydrolase n=1 Tax=Micromonospora sp. WMMA1923 TaxID=3404125 RepID=UPI003B9224DB
MIVGEQVPEAVDTGVDPVAIAQRLVRFDTTNPPGAEAACVTWIRDLLAGAGLETRLVGVDPQRPNLVARLPGRGLEPPLLLHAHVDVVPVAGQPWTRPPFAGEIVDGELWGRGAVDMKGQLAMMLAALLRMRAHGQSPPGDIILAVVSDEETGSDVGARLLVREYAHLFAGVRSAVGEDGGAELGLGGHARLHPVVVAEKRTCWVRVTFRGPGGHASRVAATGSAVGQLTRFLAAVSSGGLDVELTPVTHRMLDELARALPAAMGDRIAAFHAAPTDPGTLDGLPEETARYLRSVVRHTVAVTGVEGGTGPNVHPAELTVTVDGRVLPGAYPTQSFMDQLRARTGPDARLDLFVEGEISPAPRLDGCYDRLVAALRAHDPAGVPLPVLTTASTDARLFSQLGIACYGWLPLPAGAGYRDRLHQADERISLAALDFGADCYHSFLSGRSHPHAR